VIYLNSVVPIPRPLHGWTAVGLIATLTFVNWRSTRWGASVQNATTVIKVGFLLLLISLPLLMQKVNVSNLYPLWPEETNVYFWRSVGVAAVAVLWPYDGWVNIGPLAEEIHHPQRNIPIALGVGILIVICVYVGANTIYHLVLPMESVAGSSVVASDVFAVLLPRVGIPLAALGVMCSTFGATQSNLLTGPRIYFAMARDNLLPRRLAEVHSSFATPANAVLMQGTWASILVLAAYQWKARPADAFDSLTDFVIFGGSLFYALAVTSVFVLRWRRPHAPRPYRTWGYPLTPAIYLAAFAVALTSMLIDKWQETAIGSSLIVAGVVYYLWRSRAA
jgi:APA family basic amino acid/polyamine antiporter